MDQIRNACHGILSLSRAEKRKRGLLLHALSQASPVILAKIQGLLEGGKRKRDPIIDRSQLHVPLAKRMRLIDNSEPAEPVIDNLETNSFLRAPLPELLESITAAFIDRTGNSAMKHIICACCARELLADQTTETTIDNIPNSTLLIPINPHPAHDLYNGLLLHKSAIDCTGKTSICNECHNKLSEKSLPKYALANNMWIGAIPYELRVLTLPERILIAKFFPAAYIVKLFPKVAGAQFWDRKSLNSGIKGNVSTYRLDPTEIEEMIKGNVMPPPARILAATIGVTFVGPNKLPERMLPDFLLVRRQRVKAALEWLKQHNPIYHSITISDERLEELPIAGVPDEILDAAKYSSDTQALDKEQEGYVPTDTDDHSEDYEMNYGVAGVTDVLEPGYDGPDIEPCIIPLQALGVLDVGGDDVPDTDILAHALSNSSVEASLSQSQRADFQIQRGSAFVNEYARTDKTTGQRYDGGPSDANHLLGAFPVLFPYGAGGFEVERPTNVPYEAHARWALQYADKRFRLDLHFIFQVFGVIQKRQVCRSASLQINRSSFIKHQGAIRALKPLDLLKASREETQRIPFSNPAIQALRSQLKAVRVRVTGTDESRTSIRGKIWGTTVMLNPPSIWTTINLADTQDPIAQVLTGADIDLDNFNPTSGPISSDRGINIASDPYAASNFFHIVIRIVLEEVFQIRVKKGGHIHRSEGMLGYVNSYIGTVEAQGRGTLHLHLVLWLQDAPTAKEMKDALQSEIFREKIRQFIAVNIRADIDGADAQAIASMPREKEVAYSRPVDPRNPDYATKLKTREKTLAKAVQLHRCSLKTCQRVIGNRVICKRRAPFPLSSTDWMTAEGDWGPKRTCGYLNNWNPTFLNLFRSNHDIKLITNGKETKSITWYITNYATKKQQKSSNTSALLAHRLAHHKRQEKKADNIIATNRRLIQRCANSLSRDQEFSAPEVVSYLMGWGDRFESHHYVSIYWDTAVNTLKRAFPQLRRKGHLQEVADQTDAVYHEDQAHADAEGDAERITLVDGQLTFKDQLGDYYQRGDALFHMNYLDHMLNTYDGPKPVNNADNSEALGRPKTSTLRSERVPYKAGSDKDKRCRVVKLPGHETLPQFVGPWFPRNDRPDSREIYCASMLLLLKPWTTFNDLKRPDQTFDQSFQEFSKSASLRIKRIMENIQYYHECSDGAERKGVAEGLEGGQDFASNDESEIDVTGIDDNSNAVPAELIAITDNDIDQARYSMTDGREHNFGDHAMSIAFDANIFPEDQPDTTYKCPPDIATFDDMIVYQAWADQLKAITRRMGNSLANGTATGAEPTVIVLGGDDQIVSPTIIPVSAAPTLVELSPRSAIRAERLRLLNADQLRAHTIIENHLIAHLDGKKPRQLLMLVLGQGGTGKSLLINAITDTFKMYGVPDMLAKTGSSGVAASLIGGETLHGWAGIPINPAVQTDWTSKGSAKTVHKRTSNISRSDYLCHDECSMTTKSLLTCLSQITGKIRSGLAITDTTQPFGSLNVVMFGDFHQFPPVKDSNGALYCDRPSTDTSRALVGKELFLQFDKVVMLKEQKRIKDPVWNRILGNLRTGDCSKDDLEEISKLVLSNKKCDVPDFTCAPWSNAVLVTSRHGVRTKWNTAAITKHCVTTGNRLYISQGEDTINKTGENITREQKLIAAGMKVKQTGMLAERIEVAIGMKGMIITNIATEADVANGTRGTVVDIVLDTRERVQEPDMFGAIYLQYPPAVILFKPDIAPIEQFTGLPPGIVPICPSETTFTVTTHGNKTHSIRRRQLAITPGYAFTDYKSQGQTIEYVIVDLAKPPSGSLTPFNAYVALSRSRGRDTIRLLREIDEKLFTTHPSEDLRLEDIRLDKLDRLTTVQSCLDRLYI